MARRNKPIPFCKCGTRTILKTSWTERNPARRYIECAQNQVRGCGFWDWYDEEICERAKQVIPGLLRSKNKLEAENEALQKEVRGWQSKANEMALEIKRLKEQLEKKQRTRKLAKSVFVIGVVVTVWLIWMHEPTMPNSKRLQIASV
nr:uncharacterized protein At4g04775-like [Coffea arabica]